MPKKGQERALPTDLRQVVATNLNSLMDAEGSPCPSDKAVERASGVGYRTVGRMREAKVAANLDTIQAVAKAFNVEAWQLLMQPSASALLARIFGKPVDDERLGKNWTRPDRKILLQSSIGRRENSTPVNIPFSTRRQKAKK
jgi:hypothetical protein